MEVFDLKMLPLKSKPAKNLVWPENMSHAFQLVDVNFSTAVLCVLASVCMCKYPFPTFISTEFLNCCYTTKEVVATLEKEQCRRRE